LQAYDYYLRAADARASYHSSASRDDLSAARRFLQHALAIDPNYARAHAALAMVYQSFWNQRWDGDCPWPAALDRAYQLAHKAVQQAPDLPQARVALGWVLFWKGQHAAAIAEHERAIALNPNLTDRLIAHTLVCAGEPARAIQHLEMHMRFDPFYEPLAPGVLGLAFFMLKRYAEALPHLREFVSRDPNRRAAHEWLAATFGQLGELENARAEAAELLRVAPYYTISGSPVVTHLKRPEDIENLTDGLRKAGLPVA